MCYNIQAGGALLGFKAGVMYNANVLIDEYDQHILPII